MRRPVKSLNIKSLMTCIILLVSVCLVEVICAYAFGDGFTFRPAESASESSEVDVISQYEELGVPLDENATEGMINPKEKTGEKKPEGTVMYKISNMPVFKNGKSVGTLMIENHADNQYLIKVRIDLEDGQTVYESGFIGPNMHIEKAPLGVELAKGSYPAYATISAYLIDADQTFYADLPNKQEITIKING